MAKANENSFIVVNGEKITIKEWKKRVVEKQKTRRGKKRFLDLKKPKKEEKQVKEISAVALELERLIKPMITLKSVQVYQGHAYRSWGTIANEILSHKCISKPLAHYCVRYGELNELISEVQKMAKSNEKAAYQYVEKIAWKLDDMKKDIKDIIAVLDITGVLERFKHHEAIYGKGRHLGLRTVVTKCLKSITEIEDIVGTLKQIAEDGTDPFAYGDHMSAKTRARCWA